MKTSGVVAAILTASVASGAPLEGKREVNLGGIGGPIDGMLGSGVGSGVTQAGQNIVAEAFKAGDAILNVPADAISKLLSGDPIGALTGLGSGILNTAMSLPGDAAGIINPLMGGGSSKTSSTSTSNPLSAFTSLFGGGSGSNPLSALTSLFGGARTQTQTQQSQQAQSAQQVKSSQTQQQGRDASESQTQQQDGAASDDGQLVQQADVDAAMKEVDEAEKAADKAVEQERSQQQQQ